MKGQSSHSDMFKLISSNRIKIEGSKNNRIVVVVVVDPQ